MRVLTCLLPLLISAALAAGGETGGTPGSGKAVPVPADPEPAPELRARIEKLIAELGAPEFRKRKAAREALVAVGRPALAALRGAARSSDAEVAQSASEIIAAIEGKKGRSTVKVSVEGSAEKKNLTVTVVSSVEEVIVRDHAEAFGVEIRPAGGKITLCSEKDRAAFEKKFPEIWKKYAEPILDREHPRRAVKEAMIRELMVQAVRQFREKYLREPKPEENVALEKMVRKVLERAWKQRPVEVVDDRKRPAPDPAPGKTGNGKNHPDAPRHDFPGPRLVPTD